MPKTLIKKYLKTYSCPQIHWLNTEIFQKLHRNYEYILVIPIYDEPIDCINNILPKNIFQTLIILVVNTAENSPKISQQRTLTFLKEIDAHGNPITTIAYNQNTTLLIVDCCSPGRQLPSKQGVGLARKIGADLALICLEKGLINHPWIYCTDADVVLPENYFNPDNLSDDVAVAIYPFTHHPPHYNILLYEISLRYYVTQLSYAGSPYAFHTIGSLLIINPENYAAVRGFPKRQAAEDFYMLNKLAKTGKVLQLKEPKIVLSSRTSHRVPFGTGAAMERLANHPEFLFYHPEIFNHLKIWLNTIEILWLDYRLQAEKLTISQWWEQVNLPANILDILLNLGLEKTLKQAYRQCKDYPHFQVFMGIWFDAFRTLKFIHALRDRDFPSISLERLVKILPHLSGNQNFAGSLTDLQHLNYQLQEQEKKLPSLITLP